MRARISLIIPNRDGAAYLPGCLDAVQAQTHAPLETLVVDDGSRDGSLPLLERDYPWVRIIPPAADGRPRGFAGGVNAGLRAASGGLLALLNNDTVADPRWLEAMAAALEAHPDAASCACLVLLPGGVVNTAGLRLDRRGICTTTGDGRPPEEDLLRPGSVFGPSGCAALWRREALEGIGLFDEDYFAYYEDADLAFRARAAGWSCVYEPAARVVHLEKRCPTFPRPEKTALRIRNRAWMHWTNLPGGMLLRHAPAILWETLLRHFFKYGLRPWKLEGRAWWRGVGLLLLSAGECVRKRRRRREARTVPSGMLAAWRGVRVRPHPDDARAGRA